MKLKKRHLKKIIYLAALLEINLLKSLHPPSTHPLPLTTLISECINKEVEVWGEILIQEKKMNEKALKIRSQFLKKSTTVIFRKHN